MLRYFNNSSSAISSSYKVGVSNNIKFNTEPLPAQMVEEGYVIERNYEFIKNGAAEAIKEVTGDTSNESLAFDYTFTDVDRYLYTRTVHLYKNAQSSNPLSTLTQTFALLPYTYHKITLPENAGGLELIDVSGSQNGVKTNGSYKFKLSVKDWYQSSSNMDVLAYNRLLTPDADGVYTIDKVNSDVELEIANAPKYYSVITMYVAGTAISTDVLTQGSYFVFPTPSADQIPEGMTFAYWTVEGRTTHFSPRQQLRLSESERGPIRIDAHFADLYNLNIEEGHFYKDSACTQEISQAAHNDTVYFKFDRELDSIIDGKMLYLYDLECESTGVQIYEMGGYWQMYMPANDVRITPVYKYVIDEIAAENIAVPVAGEPFVEGSIVAPEDANYTIASSSNLCYKRVDDSTRSLVNTFNPNNPYIFENDSVYEFEFQFKIPSGTNYLLHPDGYLRDDECQITLSGLDDSEYEIVSADFTNSYKEYFKVVLRMSVINRHNLEITSGSAFIGEEEVNNASPGDEVLIAADRAVTGKVFDKWVVTGLTLTEDELSNSRLSIIMPDNVVTATATYKDAPYYQITFSPNGGSGTMADDITYGEYCLPECTLIAPEHKHFKCWEVDGEEYEAGSSISVSENTEVKAVWELDKYLLVMASGIEGVEEIGEYVSYNTAYPLPECPFDAPEGKEFAGWLVGDDTTLRAAGYEVALTADLKITAQWKDSTTPVDPVDPTSESSESETPVEPSKKKGCGGSIIATSAVLSVISLAGLGLLILKKRKEK